MKKFFVILALFACFANASIIGLDALGEHQTLGGKASDAGRGFAGGAKTGDSEGISLANPARIAYDTKVVFNINFLLEMVSAENDNLRFGTTTISIPSFNLSFPMGDFGAMGVSLWQSYASLINEDVSFGSKSEDSKIEYKSSVYEIVPNYALRLPVIRNFSLGFSAHLIMGNSMRSLVLGPDNGDVASEDAWATNNMSVTDYVEGSWKIKNHPAYYTGALQYRGRQSSYYFSFTTPYTLLNKLDYNFRFSEIDTLAPAKKNREIDVPAMLSTGINFRFLKRNNVMLDLQWRPWDSDIENIAGSFDMVNATETQKDVLVAFGLQRDGSSLYYNAYWDRITYRVGGWYKSWYVKDVHEFGTSLGAGFPLGRKGTTIDIAFQGGKRLAEMPNWEETFFGIRLGLMGIGNWGSTRK